MTWRWNKRRDGLRRAAMIGGQTHSFAIEGMESRICLSAGGHGQMPPPPPGGGAGGKPPPPPPELVAGITLDHGKLSVVGAKDTANTISVTLSGGNINVSVTGQTSQVFAATDVQCVLVAGGDQNDVITVDLGGATLKGPVQIHAGKGNDTISAGAEDDVIFGNPANYTLTGSGGTDTVVDTTKCPPPPPPPPPGGGQGGQSGQSMGSQGTTQAQAQTTSASSQQVKPAAKKRHHHHKA